MALKYVIILCPTCCHSVARSSNSFASKRYLEVLETNMLEDAVLLLCMCVPGMMLGSLATLCCQRMCKLWWPVKVATQFGTHGPAVQVQEGAETEVLEKPKNQVLSCRHCRSPTLSQQSSFFYIPVGGQDPKIHKNPDCSRMQSPRRLSLCKRCFG